MRDYQLIRGLNPKKTPPQPLAQYCAAADAAEEEIKKALPKVREALGVFLTYRLLFPKEGHKEPAAEISPARTLSELIYVGLRDGDEKTPAEPLHEEAEGFVKEALKKLLRTAADFAFSAGCRAGFGRPGEMADHLREDIGLSLSAPLEMLLPAESWQLTVRELREKYQA